MLDLSNKLCYFPLNINKLYNCQLQLQLPAGGKDDP